MNTKCSECGAPDRRGNRIRSRLGPLEAETGYQDEESSSACGAMLSDCGIDEYEMEEV